MLRKICVPHLDTRRTSVSSKKNDVLTFSLVQDEINELKKRLDKLAAKSSEATPPQLARLSALRSSKHLYPSDSVYRP